MTLFVWRAGTATYCCTTKPLGASPSPPSSSSFSNASHPRAARVFPLPPLHTAFTRRFIYSFFIPTPKHPFSSRPFSLTFKVHISLPSPFTPDVWEGQDFSTHRYTFIIITGEHQFHVGLCVENMTRSTTHHHREGKSAIVTRAAPFLGFAHSKDLEARSFTASRVARRHLDV